MSWRRSWAIVRQDARILRSDPTYLIVLTLMPLLTMGFIKPAFRGALILAGVKDATGAEQAVPGQAVLFAGFMVGNLGFAVFREHGWNTWERLRASSARPSEIMTGKVVVPILGLAIQLAVLFGVGGLVFDLHVRGSMAAIVAVAAALALALVALGLLLLALCRTIMQLNAIANVGAILLAGLGGAMTPISTLPGWARTIAPATPTYWAMRGFRSVILAPGGMSDVALPVVVLLGFAAAFSLVAGLRFSAEDTKVSWA